MRTSSVRQLEFEDWTDTSPPAATLISFVQNEAGNAPDELPAVSSTSFRIPEFRPYGQAYAQSARIAGRINALSVSEGEYQALLSERQSLLDKKFSNPMSRRDEIRLEYVRWSLDRVEDARYGASLDILESAVGAYETFLGDLKTLETQIQQNVRRRK
jgi:hypothetical protein